MMICSKSVELETKDALLESSDPSAFPLLTFVAETGDEEEAELPLRNFDPEMSEGEVRCSAQTLPTTHEFRLELQHRKV